MTTSLWVIVPAYNEAARIGGTLQCLAGQTDREFTLVVIDNGSADETAAIARAFAETAPFPVHVIGEAARGTGCAVDTGFRYAIGHGARLLARTDADCLPQAGWVAAARQALSSGAGMACGQIRARRDEHGVGGRALFRLLVTLASVFGRIRPANRRSQYYLAPYRMHAGNNMAITSTLYLATGGMPRRPAPTDRTFLNLVRARTTAIVRCRAMVVENSTRRLQAYGVLATARWYLDRGTGGHALDSALMLDDLASGLAHQPDRPAIVGVTRTGRRVVRLTRGELAGLAGGYAAALLGRGLAEGDTVGLAVRPGGRGIAVLLACHQLGLRVAVLDPAAGPDVLLARLALARPSLVLADAAAQVVAGWAGPLARRAGLELPDLTALGPVATIGSRLPGCAPCLRPQADPVLPRRRPADGPAVVVFTSGTTGKPRAVVHTRASLEAGMRAVADLVRPRAGLPVIGGTSFVLIPALASGAPVALPERSPGALARQLRLLAPQATYLTPPALRDALAAGARFTGRVWSGSAPVSADLLGRVRRAGASQAFGVYALTEMFPVAVVEASDKLAFDGDGDLVGELVPGVRARTDDAGQLLLTGPHACQGYLGEQPAEWIATGDVARDLAAGKETSVVLAGRCKDMILRGAENIYPGLYEPSLHIPGVALAVLVGLPAADGDERLVALIQLAPRADRERVRAALAEPLARMGRNRPDAVVYGTIPLAGRSRKPDRHAAALQAAAALERASC